MKLIIGPGANQMQLLNDDGSPFPLMVRKLTFEVEAGALPTMELSLEVYNKSSEFEIEILGLDLNKELGEKLQTLSQTTTKPSFVIKADEPADPLPPEAILDQFKV